MTTNFYEVKEVNSIMNLIFSLTKLFKKNNNLCDVFKSAFDSIKEKYYIEDAIAIENPFQNFIYLLKILCEKLEARYGFRDYQITSQGMR